MTRGEVYFIKPAGAHGLANEKKQERPAVIVGNDMLTEMSNKVQVCYLTTRDVFDSKTRVHTRCTGKPAVILCEEVYTVGQDRIGNFAGALNAAEMNCVDIALAVSLSLDNIVATEPTVIEKPVEKIVTRELSEEEYNALRAQIRMEIEGEQYAQEMDKLRNMRKAEIRGEIEEEQLKELFKEPRKVEIMPATEKTSAEIYEDARSEYDSKQAEYNLAKAEAERDVYRKMYYELLEKMLPGASKTNA